MNLISKKILVASMTAALAGGSQLAHADSSADAYIDWENLTIQYFDLSGGSNAPVLTWTKQLGDSHADAYNFDPNDEVTHTKHAPNFDSFLLTEATTTYAQSMGWRDSSDLEANAASQVSASSLTDWPFPNNNSANANVQNSGEFVLSGYGLALITLDWEISGNSDGADPFNDYASAGVSITGNYDNGTASSFSNVFSKNTGFDGDFDESGTFSMAIFGDGVQEVMGSLSAQAWASSYSVVSMGSGIPEVPVPGAVWMFSSALLGLIGISRRKVTA
ncbi:MAG: hypothetical protein ACU836_01390 [Gammaproteobacteria bacterium]